MPARKPRRILLGVTSGNSLLNALRRCWGYDSFRPLQERIVGSILAAKDTCVVMPTGGGKSLCYQLPAALMPEKTALVVSPLIALMQDQVAQLEQIGIPSAALNSTLPADQQARVMRNAAKGEYRLLYLSPERLARNDSLAWLAQVPVSLFVIDEAHCISEWGHEFRPEYRQLSRLRERFPGPPIAAFTASATRRVRHDIIEQLHLRDPHKYIASFHRPNLRYAALQCSAYDQSALLLSALRAYPQGNIIVYAPTIASVETTVDFLEERGIPAVAYHGQMDAPSRRRNQERWMSDEVRVLVGTIAFGLGINKAAVRAVIHLSLPKSIEQYYQEAGRAGRDGLPSDCVMLWQKRDVGLLTYFIQQITDPAEAERAWQRYRDIIRFAESKACRHRQICAHFGEIPKWTSCRACDACGVRPAWLTQPLDEQQPRHSKKRKRGTAAPQRVFSEGPAGASTASADHTELREYLRQWRREAAGRLGIPAFTVMHDSSLEEICQKRPQTLAQLRLVFGFGEHKTNAYGTQILETLAKFQHGARASTALVGKPKPAEETAQLLAAGRTLQEIANLRGRRLATVVALVAEMVERGDLQFQPAWLDAHKFSQIEVACAAHGLDRLKLLKDALPPEITYDEIRLVVAHRRALANIAGNGAS
ncbi:MAG: RecQ family ATP-dependent DNA helicase [Candidatus Acidiferrales bacterium]